MVRSHVGEPVNFNRDNMFTLKNFLDLVEDNCTVERFPTDLLCYGANTSIYSAYVKDDYECCAAVNDLGIRELNLYDYKNARNYRWTVPEVEPLRAAEFLLAGIDPDICDGDQEFIDLIMIEDMIEKMTAICAGQEYDTRITIPLELSDEEFILIARAAHKLDVTINEYMVQAVKDYLWKIA